MRPTLVSGKLTFAGRKVCHILYICMKMNFIASFDYCMYESMATAGYQCMLPLTSNATRNASSLPDAIENAIITAVTQGNPSSNMCSLKVSKVKV